MDKESRLAELYHQREKAAPEQGQLSKITLFLGLSHSQLNQISPYLYSHHIPNDTIFIHYGNTGSGLFFLITGSVKVFIPSSGQPVEHKREVLISICGPGETLGEIDLADGGGHTASVATLEDSVLWWMAADDFWHCHNMIPQLGRNLSFLLARRTRWCTAAHDALATLHLPGKVAYFLLLLIRDYGQSQPDGSILLPLRLSRDEIASMIGSAREGVSRVLTSFREQGYIEVQPKRQLLIRDTQALRNYCEGLVPAPVTFSPQQ